MHFLITAGATREFIDPVRFISNASSGRMGYALGSAAVKAGHKVTLITGSVALRPPGGVKIIKAETGGEMFAAVKKFFAKCDCLIMAAAVCDYAPVRAAKRKIKKSAEPLVIKFAPTADILKWAGANKKHQIVVGFALEDRAIRRRAEKKLKEKKLDMIIANTPAAIGSVRSTVQIKRRNSVWTELKNASKESISRRIISIVCDFK